MDSKNTFLSTTFHITAIVFFFVTGVVADMVYAKDVANSCIECHSQSNFRVTDKKLYKYYRDWELSIHAQEGVTCVDCHGGDPNSSDKDKAHGDDIRKVHGDDIMSILTAVAFERISATCGRCHKNNAKNYEKSKHFRILKEKGRSQPTPTCITCHGSINTSIPKSDYIAGICAHCHNAVTENRPEIPEIASYLVGRLAFIKSYYLHLISKGVLEKSPEFSKKVNMELSDLAKIWHTLDLDRIEDKTLQIRTMMMKKGKELRKELKQAD